MSVVANVAINVDASKAIGQLRTVDQAADQVASSAARTEGAVGRLSRAFSGLGGVLASFGASAALRGITQAGIEAGTVDVRIKQLTKSFSEYAKVQNIISQNAKTFNQSQTESSKNFADIYARLRPLGISLENINKVFVGFNTAAAQSGLTASQASPAFTQLAQALGSGALRGDEFNSIAEQVPGILGAIAQAMGVPVGSLRNLAAQGEITSAVVIQALSNLAQQGKADLAALADSPAGLVAKFQQAIGNLQATIGTKLLPAFTPLIQGLTNLINAFNALPQPIQSVIAVVSGLVLAIGAIAAPIGFIVSGLTSLASALGGFGAAAAVFGVAAGAVKAVLVAIATVLSGPAGVVIAIGAVIAALYTFREQISNAFSGVAQILGVIAKDFIALGTIVREMASEAFNAIQNGFGAAAKFIGDTFVDPVRDIIGGLTDFISGAFSELGNAIVAPFRIAAKSIKSVFDGIANVVLGTIRFIAAKINDLIRGANQISSTVGIPAIPYLSVPAFAQGGYVTKKTLAMVGEGGEPEYIIPASKMPNAIQNYANGARGNGVLASSSFGKQLAAQTSKVSLGLAGQVLRGSAGLSGQFAGRGTGGTSQVAEMQAGIGRSGAPGNGPAIRRALTGRSGAGLSTTLSAAINQYAANKSRQQTIRPQINITTGPVTRMADINYVTMRDLVKATESAAKQGANMALGSLRSDPSTRRAVGLAR